jgi:hypothetical protein
MVWWLARGDADLTGKSWGDAMTAGPPTAAMGTVKSSEQFAGRCCVALDKNPVRMISREKFVELIKEP